VSEPRGRWVRVSRSHPCPVCGKPDWCLVAADGSAAICPRTESDRDLGESGFLHRLRGDPGHQPPVPHVGKVARRPPLPDLTRDAERFRKAVTGRSLELLSSKLGPAVPVETLLAFGVGWSSAHLAWTIPSVHPMLGAVTGIQLRRVDGSKLSVKGSRYALYSPRTQEEDRTLLVCEGPTDAMAAFALGFRLVAGRHNCKSGAEYVVHLVRKHKPLRVVVVADGDDHGAGIAGAMALAEVLAFHHKDVVVYLPPEPHKDLRAWANAGCSRQDVEGRK
jgi:hypothetical protein